MTASVAEYKGCAFGPTAVIGISRLSDRFSSCLTTQFSCRRSSTPGLSSKGTGRGCAGQLQRLANRAARGATQVFPAVPLMLDATHQQGAIKLDRAFSEKRLVFEEAGPYLLYFQRLRLPVETPQLQALEARRIACR